MLDDHDHRALGQRLDLFHFQEEAPGMVFWHPRGFALFRALEDAIRRRMLRDGLREVRGPQLIRRAIWESSGHWDHFSAGMFRLDDNGMEAALKPVSCPGHMEIVRRMLPSYRELPLRLGELGLVHRNEPSGTLHGLFRLRQFTQDDGHIFCSEEQVDAEVAGFCASLKAFYAALGFDELGVSFSTRPPECVGSDEVWDRAEAALLSAARRAGLDPVEQRGEGAFYGPKLEFSLRDRLGRPWQCGTIQLDQVLPERFDVSYVNRAGARRRPAVLHRALMGSLERFVGILLEHHAGALPPWLAPEQIVVAPVAEAHAPYAARAVEALRERGLRAVLDGRSETLAKRIAEAHAGGIPLVAIAGGREVERGALTLRSRDGAQRELPLDGAAEELARWCQPVV